VGNITERLEAVMLGLSFLSFCAGFALTAAATYYGSVFMALMAIFSFGMGILLYSIYRAPSLGEGMESLDERRHREALYEFAFLVLLFGTSLFSFGVVGNLFVNVLSRTEAIIAFLLPPSLGVLGMMAFLTEFSKGSAGSPPQLGPVVNQDQR